jgi:hypothetical protein
MSAGPGSTIFYISSNPTVHLCLFVMDFRQSAYFARCDIDSYFGQSYSVHLYRHVSVLQEFPPSYCSVTGMLVLRYR